MLAKTAQKVCRGDFPVSGVEMIAAILVSALCLPVVVQHPDRKQDSTNEPAVLRQQIGQSKLEKQNLGSVAASTAQIQAVRAKDTGLLVELKRSVAKEAANNGPTVQDADLTDQGILDRSSRDVKCHWAVTRLLEPYGNLMAMPDPEGAGAADHPDRESGRFRIGTAKQK